VAHIGSDVARSWTPIISLIIGIDGMLHRDSTISLDQVCDFMIELIVPIGAGLLAFIYAWVV